MANQNMALIGHQQINSWTSSFGMSGLTSVQVFNDDGQHVATTDYGQFPGYRIMGKLYFDTTVSSFSASHINVYVYSSGNYDQYATYSSPSNTVYSTTNQQTGSYTGGNGYSYIRIGEGCYPSKYNGTGSYNWGSSVTDVDGNTVAPDSPRRGVWTNFVIDAYYQNTNKMPSIKIKTAAATNGFSNSTTDTYEQYSGRYYNGGGGSNNYYNFDSIYITTSYNCRGEWFCYRIGRGNWVGGS
tara:strand:- start:2520 stop:3242 length:723 start_codon:yes stop_codon:yes gene_type:complete